MKKSCGKKYGFLTAVILAALGSTGCTGGSREAVQTEAENENIVIGFSEVGAESDWRVANTESMRNTFTEEKGYELMFNDAKQKQENQISAIRNYILQAVDYIVFAPAVEEGWDEVLQEAKDAGIPVIIMDRMINTEDESLFTAWEGSDFYAEGVTAMEWLEEYLEEQGRADEEISILHVKGTVGATSQIGRTEGLENGVAAHENWEIAACLEGEYTQAKTYEVVAEYLETDTDIDVIYCENDNSAFGAIQALEEAGISYGVDGDVIIISFDATEAGLTACMNGQINLDVECNPLNGPRVEMIIQQLENGETPEKYSYVDETYFVPEDLTEDLIASREY
ncbi:MAG: ABC transporter substrate-binding protein [Eubacteriales bacterium]|nr:ABC transporter substrate-binding protein [Eubacteriales bacterium]